MAFNDAFTGLFGQKKDPNSQPPRPLTRAEMDSVEGELTELPADWRLNGRAGKG